MLNWIDAEKLENRTSCQNSFADVHGILVPGGFGERGAKGKINAIEFARINNIPFFGIIKIYLTSIVIEKRHFQKN